MQTQQAGAQLGSSTVAGSSAAARRPAVAVPTSTLRIGLEFLAPEGDSEPADIRVEATGDRRVSRMGLPEMTTPLTPAPTGIGERADRLARRHTWTLDAGDLATMANPMARETLHFFEDLLDEDRRAAAREVRVPFFDWQHHEATDDPLLASEFALLSAREEWIHEHGPHLLQRPLRKLLRRLPAARSFEVAVEDWRSDHVPLTESYQLAHQDQTDYGRISMRLRTSDWNDPLEVVYVRGHVRVGTSQEYSKLSWNVPLATNLRFEVRGRRDYDGGDYGWRCNLIYQHSPRTSLHLSAGDDLEFLSTSSIFSLFESPMDGQAGVVMYAVHVF